MYKYNLFLQTFWSALHWAADRENDELVYILLEADIDPTLRDMVSYTL